MTLPHRQSPAPTPAAAPTRLPDDYALMQSCAAGDESALSTLFDRYAPTVKALARRILNDATEAEDLLVDLFYEVWRRADQYDPTRASPLTYILTLARSRAIDRRRSAQSRAKITAPSTAAPDPATDDNPLTDTLGRERRAIVTDALSQLDPDQRQALECSYYEGLSHSEIAAKLNRPLGTIKGWVRQGLIRLRDQLRKRYDEEPQSPPGDTA